MMHANVDERIDEKVVEQKKICKLRKIEFLCGPIAPVYNSGPKN